MKQYIGRVVESRVLWSNVQFIAVRAPEIAATICPGQRVLARDPTSLDPYLRHRLWMYGTRGEDVYLTLPTHDMLVPHARVDSWLDLLAPVGRAIEFDASVRHLLLLGENDQVAPLVPVAQNAIAQGRAVVLGMHVHSDQHALPAFLLPPEVEYRMDGEMTPDLYSWADHILASGSDEFYSDLVETLRSVRYRFEPGWVSVLRDPIMPCGSGACYACAIETSRGIRLACTDGPAFDLYELERRRTR